MTSYEIAVKGTVNKTFDLKSNLMFVAHSSERGSNIWNAEF